MNSELLQMQATIRAIGEAVADMAKVCEGLPRLFDTKLAAFRAEMTSTLGEVKEATAALLEKQAAGLAEVQAGQATLTGQFAAQQGAAQAALAGAVAGVEARTLGIIADNAKAVAESISGCETLLREGLVVVRKECDPTPVLEAVRGLQARADSLEEKAEGTQLVLNEHGDRLENVNTKTDNLGGTVLGVIGRVDTVEDSVGKVVAESAASVAQLIKEVDDVHKDLNQHAAEQSKLFTEVQASIQRRVSSVSEALVDLTGRVTELGVDATARVDELRGTVTTLREYVESDITDQLAAVAGQAQKAESIALDKLTELEKRVGAVDERVSNVDASHVTHSAGVRDELMAAITSAVERFASDIVATEERITGKVSDTAVGLLELAKKVDDETAAICVEYRAGLADLREATAKDVEATERRVACVEGTLAEIVTGDTYARTEEVQRSLGSIVVNVENVTAELGTLEQNSATNYSELCTRIAGVQENVVQLQEDVQHRAKVADLRPIVANVDAVTQHAEELEQQVATNHSRLRTQLAGVQESVVALQAVEKDLQSAQAGIQSNLDIVTVHLGDVEQSFNEHKAGVAVSIASIGSALNDKVDVTAMDKALAEETGIVRDAISAVEVRAKSQFDELVQRLDEQRAGSAVALSATANSFTEKVDALECSLRADFGDDVKSLRTDLEATHAATKEALAKKVEESAVERIMETFNGAVVQVNSASVARTGELADEIKVAISALGDQLKTVGTEAALTAVDVSKLAAKVEEIQPVQNIEVPELQMAAEYDDGHVTLSFLCGEQTAAVAIPVDIGVRYRGIWEQSSKALPGDVFTHKGSMWVCKSGMPGEPGKDFTGWQLAVKRGSDGKDGHSPMAYEDHKAGRTYKSGDFLRLNNRLWQCGVAETKSVPEPSDIATTRQWILIGGAQ